MAAFTVVISERPDGMVLAECGDVPEFMAMSDDEDEAVAEVIEAITSRVLH